VGFVGQGKEGYQDPADRLLMYVVQKGGVVIEA
jgi:hypothetical protein